MTNPFAKYKLGSKNDPPSLQHFTFEQMAQPVVRHLLRTPLAKGGKETVRQLVHRSSQRRNGIHNFAWLHKSSVIHRESILESSFLYQVAVCPLVHAIYSQPVEVAYSDTSQPDLIRRYTPDFLVIHQSGFCSFIEVKHSELLKRSSHDFELIKAGFEYLGYGYLLLTEQHLNDRQRLETAQLIKRYSVVLRPRGDLLSFLRSRSLISLQEIADLMKIGVIESSGLIPWCRMWFDPCQSITGSMFLSVHNTETPNEHLHIKSWFVDPLWCVDLLS